MALRADEHGHGRGPPPGGQFRAPFPSEGVRRISYGGHTVAFADGDRVLLSPEVAARPLGDPLRRFVGAMCAFSAEVDSGEIPGEYDDERAARHARMALIPVEELLPLLGSPPEELAELFAVPLEEVRRRLRELRHPWPADGL